MPFERRSLGRTDLKVSPVGIGGGYGLDSGSIEWAFEQGINYFFYAPWVPTYLPMKQALKNLLPRHRDELVIATASYSWLLPGSIERSVKKHLRLLEVDRIDLLLLGWVVREAQQRAVDELARVRGCASRHLNGAPGGALQFVVSASPNHVRLLFLASGVPIPILFGIYSPTGGSSEVPRWHNPFEAYMIPRRCAC